MGFYPPPLPISRLSNTLTCVGGLCYETVRGCGELRAGGSCVLKRTGLVVVVGGGGRVPQVNAEATAHQHQAGNWLKFEPAPPLPAQPVPLPSTDGTHRLTPLSVGETQKETGTIRSSHFGEGKRRKEHL